MESSCPHLGADMSHAEIEECETSVVAVCPWHRYSSLSFAGRTSLSCCRYDFDLETGKSETGLQTCTYPVVVKEAEGGVHYVYMEAPKDGTDWKLIELRPVSEGAP